MPYTWCMKLGVFDSGIGGEAIAAALRLEFPNAELQIVNDSQHVPYGDRTSDDIRYLTNKAIQPLLNASCDVIIIACNSATSAALEWLRLTYPEQLFIGLEPMVKPAASLSKSKVITVCATPATLRGERYKKLVQTYCHGMQIIEPDCSDWARMIEKNEINEETIKQTVRSCLDKKSDVIVLGCTHYHWIKSLIAEEAAGHAIILEPSQAITWRIRYLLNDSTAATN